MVYKSRHCCLRSTLASLLIMLVTAMGAALPAYAQTLTPQDQCTQGVRLMLDQKPVEAGPLLEAGFAARENVAFASPEALGLCSWALGYVRLFKGDHEGALEAFQIALTAFRRGDDQAYTISALYAVGQTHQQLRNLTKAEAAYKEATALAQRINNPSFGLAALGGLMVLYDDQGRFTEVIEVHRQRLPLLVKPEERAVSYGNAGKAYLALGRLTEAFAVLQQALQIFRDLNDHQGQAAMLNRLGEVVSAQGRSAEAMRYFEQATMFYRREGQAGVFGAVNAETNRANEYRLRGRYGIALDRYNAALDELDRLPTTPITANFVLDTRGQFLNNIAVIYLEQANTQAAEPLLEESLAIARELGLKPMEATRLINRGSLYEQQAVAALSERDRARLLDQALADYKLALTIGEKLGLSETQYGALNAMGVVMTRLARYDEAIVVQRRALQFAREQGVPSTIATVLVNLGTSHHDQGRYGEALAHFTEALTIAEASSLRRIAVEASLRIARTIQLQGNSAEALTQYEQALADLGQLRATAGDDQARAGFVGKFADVYERVARLYLEQGDVAAAFETVERGRARSLLDSLVTGDLTFADDSLNVEAERLRETDATLEAARRELALIKQAAPTNPTLITRLEARVTEAEQEYQAAREAIAQRGDRAPLLLPDGAIRSAAEIQALIPDDTSLLTFQVGAESTLVFVATREDVTGQVIPAGRAAIVPLVRAVVAFDGDGGASARAAADLYTTLIEPVRSQIETSRLIIVPYGILHYLPFAALMSGDQRYLGDDFRITLLPAAALLPFVQRAHQPGPTIGTSLIMANPDARIPNVVAAAEQIGALLGQAPLRNEQATVAAFREQAPNAQIIHIGAHGSFVMTSTLQSNIQLYGGASGRLTTQDIYSVALNETSLITLSACETQVNQLSNPKSPLAVTAGDELVGFQRAFFFAGAQNVVTTLWQVPDKPSRMLMERFYTHIRDGLAPADALQRAQQDVRAEYPNPQDWAGFVLSGVGATPLVVPPPLPWWQQVPWWWVLGSAALVLLLSITALWRRRVKTTL